MNFLRSFGLYLAWVIALAGALLSLYFSELNHIEPCRYCWYQRVALFPLAIQLGIFTYRGDTNAALYGIPLCFVGFLAALIQSVDLMSGYSWSLRPDDPLQQGDDLFIRFNPVLLAERYRIFSDRFFALDQSSSTSLSVIPA